MTPLVVLGVGAGSGISAIVAGLARRRPTRRAASTGWLARALTTAVRYSSGPTTIRQDLAVLGRSPESLAVATAQAAIAGACSPVVLYLSLAGAGIHVPVSLAALGLVVMGLAAAAAPALLVRRAAGLARQDVVHSLACWLELVALALAGGMGVESALEAASGVAGDSSFLRIRRALERARHAGSSPWDGLGRLGAELGVDELEELAASLRLAGTEGARVRASLSAKSGSLRRRQMAEAQGRANAITERLFLPAIVLMIGFVVFLIYPAGVTLSRVL